MDREMQARHTSPSSSAEGASAPQGAVLPGQATGGRVVLAARELKKHFGHVQALRGATIDVHAGEVVALFGDNGAGKSTLLKSLCGVVIPDGGTTIIEDQPVRLTSIRDAQALGVDVVFQDLALAPDLTVAENMFLGHEIIKRRWGFLGVLHRREMADRADAALKRLSIHLPSLQVPVKALSGGQRQAVAVARAMMWARSAVLLDEPTAALGARQSDVVAATIRTGAGHGLAILVVSHDIPRTLAVADRIYVLRHGIVVWGGPSRQVTVQDVVTHMVGVGQEASTSSAEDET